MSANTPNNSNQIQAGSDALSENTAHLPAGRVDTLHDLVDGDIGASRVDGEFVPVSATPVSGALTPETGALGITPDRRAGTVAGTSTWAASDLSGSSFNGDHNLIEALNDLIHTCRDGEKGFMQGEKDATDPSLKLTLRDLASRCASAIVPLQEIVSSLGGMPANDGTISGAMHRGWTGLKTSVTSDKDHAILEECERGEDYAKRAYRKALEVDMPANVRTVIESQYQGVVECHDRVKALRDSHASMNV